MTYPSVTVITPTTFDRSKFNDEIKENVKRQRYNGAIEHILDYSLKTIGEKRNALCLEAKGDIIIHFDSDDLYADDWIHKSVVFLLNNKADMTGLNKCYFASPKIACFFKYEASQPYVCGATMCYTKKHWEKYYKSKGGFRNFYEGEDTAFCGFGGRIIAHNYSTGFIARIHGANTASHEAFKLMQKIPYADLPNI